MRSDADHEELLRHLAPERREAVRSFLSEVVAECPHCGAAVTRTSPRGLDAEGAIGCFACVTHVVGRCSVCGDDLTRQHKLVVAGGRQAHDTCAKRR